MRHPPCPFLCPVGQFPGPAISPLPFVCRAPEGPSAGRQAGPANKFLAIPRAFLAGAVGRWPKPLAALPCAERPDGTKPLLGPASRRFWPPRLAPAPTTKRSPKKPSREFVPAAAASLALLLLGHFPPKYWSRAPRTPKMRRRRGRETKFGRGPANGLNECVGLPMPSPPPTATAAAGWPPPTVRQMAESWWRLAPGRRPSAQFLLGHCAALVGTWPPTRLWRISLSAANRCAIEWLFGWRLPRLTAPPAGHPAHWPKCPISTGMALISQLALIKNTGTRRRNSLSRNQWERGGEGGMGRWSTTVATGGKGR